MAHRSLSDVLETSNPDWGSFWGWKKKLNLANGLDSCGLAAISYIMLSCSPICKHHGYWLCLTDCWIITSILKNKRKKSRSWKPGYTLEISTLDPPLKAVWPWGPAPQSYCSFLAVNRGQSPHQPCPSSTWPCVHCQYTPPSPAGLWTLLGRDLGHLVSFGDASE